MRLRYTKRAVRHLDAIADYIAQHDPAAAMRVGTRIRASAMLLVDFPLMGHDGTLAGTREIVAPGLPYIIVHRVEADEIAILGIYHGAQLRPGQSEL